MKRKNYLVAVECLLILVLIAYFIYDTINIIGMWKDFNDTSRFLNDELAELKKTCTRETIQWLVISFILFILVYAVNHIRNNRNLLEETIEVLYKQNVFKDIERKIEIENKIQEKNNDDLIFKMEEYLKDEGVNVDINLCEKCGYQIFPEDEKCSNCGKIVKKNNKKRNTKSEE